MSRQQVNELLQRAKIASRIDHDAQMVAKQKEFELAFEAMREALDDLLTRFVDFPSARNYPNEVVAARKALAQAEMAKPSPGDAER